jgi:hypothetical protein
MLDVTKDSTTASKVHGLDHSDLKRMVETASDETETARARSEQCRDYYDSKQWTAEETAILKKRKQPVLTINRIKRKVDSIVGIEQKGRVDPRALPRNPDDEQAADVATKALVFVEDITRFDMIRSAFCYNLAIEGYGGVEVGVREKATGIDPDLIRLRWEEIFFDPFSRDLDFGDAEYKGVQKWMSLDKAIDFCRGYDHGLSDEELSDMLMRSMENNSGSTYDDRPASATVNWGDKKKKRVKLAYMYYRCEGTWYLALLCGGGVIYNEVSPYLDYTDDPAGVPDCAIILQSCYIDRDNARYGVVLDWISAQDEVNKRRSKALHMLNSRQTMGQQGALAGMRKADGSASDNPIRDMKRELAMPDGHVEYNQDPAVNVPSFQIIPNQDQLQGQLELLQESKGEIDMLGPNASLLGQLDGDQSGRAIIAQQQAGMAELAPFYDNLKDWTLRVYRAMWNRIRQFWTEPRWIRVTDETEGLQFLGINQPQVDPMTGQPAVGPDGQPMIENEVGSLDIDIIIDMSPEYASLQQEEFQSLVELAKSGMVQFPPEVLIEASSLRNKRKIIEKMSSPEEAQMKQQATQLQFQEKEAQVAKLTAEAQAKAAEGQLKAQQMELEGRKLEIDQQRMQMEGRKAEIDAANAEREGASKAAEMQFKARELEMKAQEAALQPPLTAAEIELKNAQAEKTRAEIGKMAADIALGQRQQTANEQGMSADRELKTAEIGLKAKEGNDKVGLAKDQMKADAKAEDAKAEEPKKPRKSRFTVKRNKDGLIEALDREDVD